MSLRVFVGEALADFGSTGAVAPSSKYLATAMLDPLPMSEVRVALEFGAGTGAITHSLLQRLPRDAKLLVFEINPSFYHCLQETISDPRVILINSSVENLATELDARGIKQVDAVASSMALAFMPERVRRELFEHLAPLLHQRSVFTQYQYIHGMQFIDGRLRRFDLRSLLKRYFASVEMKIEWRNLPPAFVFTCHA
jgi:phosphatidylethanolamine/phosphatidyl-N-methylethanolamine N-methyltransferase